MSRKVELLELDISTENLVKNGARAQKEIERLKEEQTFFRKSIKEGKKTIEEYNQELARLEKQGKKNSQEYINLKKNADAFSNNQEKNRQKLELITNSLTKQKQEYRNNQRAITDFNKAVESELGIITETDGSINQLNRALANNRKIYRDLTEEQRENTEIGGKLFKVISDQDQKYKDLQSSIGTTQVRVGDYKEQIKQALAESSGFSQTLDSQIQRIPVVGTQLSSVVKVTRNYTQAKLLSAKATDTGTRSLKAFKLALIGTGIGAILVLLGSLIAYFSSTQKGIDKVNKVLTPLKVVFQSLLGVLQDLGETMFETFSNPKKLLAELLAFLKNQVINRFKAFGVILEGIVNLDFKKIANGIAQGATGVENIIDKTKNAGKEVGNFFDEAWQRGKRIEEIQQQLNKGEADYILNLAKAKEEFKANNKIAEDQTKTLAEREKAANKSIENQKEINRLENERLDLQIEQMKLEQQSNDTSDAERAELAKLIAQRNESRTRQLEAETTQQNKLNTIRKEAYNKAVELQKKRTDEAIKESKLRFEIFKEEYNSLRENQKDDLKFAEEIKNKKIEILNQELKAKRIIQTEYDLERLRAINEFNSKRDEIREIELQKEKDFENRKKELQEEIELRRIEDANQKALMKAELDYQKQISELETLELNETQKTELLKLLTEERNQIIAEIRETALNDMLAKEMAINERLIQSDRTSSQIRAEIAGTLTNTLTGFLGDSISAQLASIAIEAGMQAGLVKLNAAAASGRVTANIAAANAKAILSSPLTGGMPFVAANTAQGVALQTSIAASSTQAISRIVAGAAIKGFGTIAGNMKKAEHGATFTIGGNRHSSGGTKFYGEDGTAFEAEKDERMFILNRKASAMLGPILSDINQQYGGVALSNASSYLQSGGEVLRGISTQTVNNNQKIDTSGIREAVYQGSKEGIAQANIKVKPSEIIDVYNENQAVVNGANN